MSVRFTKTGLMDELGEEIEISYDKLSKKCLRDHYSTIRIREIIFCAIEEVLGQKVIVNNYYTGSILFSRLEKAIQKHPEYQVAKQEIRKRAELCKDRTPKVDTRSISAQRAFRRMVLDKKRGR